MSKTCTVCKMDLPLTDYYNSSVTKDGKGYRCIRCDVKAREKYRKDNYERFLEKSRRTNLKCKYGLTVEEYDELLRKQKDCCAICQKHVSENNGPAAKNGSQRLCIDHDHLTGKVRGLLCNNCNRGLGLLGDTKEAIERVLKYLDVH